MHTDDSLVGVRAVGVVDAPKMVVLMPGLHQHLAIGGAQGACMLSRAGTLLTVTSGTQVCLLQPRGVLPHAPPAAAPALDGEASGEAGGGAQQVGSPCCHRAHCLQRAPLHATHFMTQVGRVLCAREKKKTESRVKQGGEGAQLVGCVQGEG